MTVSGQRLRAENVAAPKPSRSGQRPAAKITARTPLPKGWASFCSEPDSQNPARWYAQAPWSVFSLIEKHGPKAEYLAQLVNAPTWTELHKKVNAQVTIYESLNGDQQ
jgi:hypothetical protein